MSLSWTKYLVIGCSHNDARGFADFFTTAAVRKSTIHVTWEFWSVDHAPAVIGEIVEEMANRESEWCLYSIIVTTEY